MQNKISSEAEERINYFLEGPVNDFCKQMQDIENRANSDKNSFYNFQYVEEINQVEKKVLDSFAVVNDFLGGYKDSPKKFSPELKNLLKKFRYKVGHFYLKSPIHKGPISKAIHFDNTEEIIFPGDTETLMHIYSNAPLSQQGFSHSLDLTFLNYPLAEAIKGRIEKVGSILYEDIMNSTGSYKAVSLASGPAQEWVTILPLIPEKRKKDLTIFLLDNDVAALKNSQMRLEKIKGESKIYYMQNHIAEIVNGSPIFNPDLFKKFKNSQIVYTVGLGDYINDALNLFITDAQFNLTGDKGKVLTCFKDASKYDPNVYFAKANWVFKRKGRDEASVNKLFIDNLKWSREIPLSKFRDDRTGIVHGFVWDKSA